ncbi:1-phosphatidylinositol-3-phosphate 5-kinase FAB1B-like isoform X2 [Papaver somniferum]|uniref:1-phosphatidylinositol-3-phosphate 5-kinase FAB1B-like isoform X2 n=1 Tax=Papaver somniferum TaxID=3469 RepID=UPI000E705DA2|nr:1-phosphatidylinositol-3-phosphate 5-kinase FAB1B-like isoform X2 [Papaver somniferum]
MDSPTKSMTDDELLDGGEKSETASSSSVAESKMVEPVDFENNGLLWIPPGPDDLEDDEEAVLFYDDEDDATAEWRHLSPLTSFGDGESSTKEKSGEEHKKAMKNVVDGQFRALVAQLLQVENLPVGEEDDSESWLDIVISLSWEAATLLKPDTSKEGLDPGGYVKVKCLACGRRSESMVVKGVVCKKNVAHKHMRNKIEKPRFLILGGALEYPNSLSNIITLSDQQEMDHLEMAVATIEAQHPTVLLVEKSVSRSFQEYLHGKDIAVVLNLKRPLLERIARCTGAQIVPSIDNLSSRILGFCDTFRVEKFLELHGSAGQNGKKLEKTLMFFEGCPKPLGCTILLRGANGDELKKVKHVVQYGISAVYHLALETSFLADEGASFPLKSPITVAYNPSANNVEALESTGGGELSSSDLTTLGQDRKNSREEQGSSKEDFPQCTTDHQSILVSLSTRCVWKGTVCERAHIFRIKYYGSSDKPLGRFLRDHLFDQSFRCRLCKMPSEAHIHSYTHGQGTLTISVKKLEILLPGEGEGKIWMWHRCLQCSRLDGIPPSTLRVVMSDAAWSLSFGKFLELSFSNHAAADCGHSLHRDCVRFYGFGRLVACFRYASTNVHSVYLPPSKLDFNYNKQDWIQHEANEVVNRAGHLFAEVSNALRKIADQRTGSRGLITELEGLLKTEEAEFEEYLQNALNREEKKGQPFIDIIEINGLRRQLIFNIYLWDQRLVYAANTDNKPFKEKLNTSAPSAEYLSETLEDAWIDIQDQREEDRRDDNVEQFPAWVRVPFLELYKNSAGRAPKQENSAWYDPIYLLDLYLPSVNKNSSMSTPKLDNLGQYNPVYLPVVREWPRLGGARFFLPIGVDGTVVPVYDDEPTSVISYTLSSPEYHSQISGEGLNGGSSDSKSLHATVSFTDYSPQGKVKYTVTCYYSSRFEALRRMCCPSELDFIRSLSRCKKWGKSNVFFTKSLDDRFIIKQVTKTELEYFLQFAPEYFKYLTESIDTRIPTCLSKILGIYQVTSKHQNGGKDARMDVFVMENLLFGRNLTRLYDLKGSTQSRYNADASESNKVLLDQNLIEEMPTSPIFVGNKAKRLLERAVWNDTSFLASINVMDYSLLVGMDEEKQELVVGIIDFMRQYTWDKHLETWVKTLSIFGGAKNSTPTVISPKQYMKRFRKAMSEYFLMVPDQWSPQNIIPSASQSDLGEDNTVKVSSP